MYVIGTAGHVDHGKSTLVKALTGIDPDRLKEEKEREMTIDLGFAWLTLPNGVEVGVVDVPGHERLVRNMLAGVGGIDLALLVVAADEGVMPQTREHLAILDLLRLKTGVIVLTKKDLVDDDWLELVTSEVKDALAPTSLAGAPIVSVSSVTGEGLDRLKAVLAETLAKTEPRKDLGRPRLPIDRAFVMTGFGTVVTGTLIGGSLQLGQEVEIVPKGLRGRIRGLQSHRKKIEMANPGRRVAVNLAGIDHTQLERGDVLATPGWLTTTEAFDARIQLVRDAPAPLRHNAPVTFHSYTLESPARVRLLDADELRPGESAWAQIKLQHPAPVVKGDLFILRNASGTIGGGAAIEPLAKRHRRHHEETLHRLEVLAAGSPEEVVLEALASHEPCEARALVKVTNRSWDEVKSALMALASSGRLVRLTPGELGPEAILYSATGFDRLVQRLRAALGDFHERFPLRRGMMKEEVRSRLSLTPQAFTLVLQHLVGQGALAEDGPVIRLPAHKVALTPDQERQVQAFLAALSASPFSPPSDIPIDPELLNYLLEDGRVVKAGPDVIFTSEAYQQMTDRVVQRIRQQGKVTLAEVRDLFGTSRKYVQALLEHMDQQRITRRVGDERVLR